MKNILVGLLMCASWSVWAQSASDSTKTIVYNRSAKSVYICLAYYKRLSEGNTALCTYGWFELTPKSKKIIWLTDAQTREGVFYNAHNTQNRNDNWGGSLFYLVHPTLPFHLAYANNASLVTALESDGLNPTQLKELQTYPFRDLKWNAKNNCFQLNLLD